MESLTRQRMIENITMLWTLNEVPEPPKENAIDCSANETRQLTPARERQLVDNLAFISASTDDMLRVMAVCIEERSDQQGMTIRLASNTGDLSPTVKSFEVIACTLERAALRGTDHHESLGIIDPSISRFAGFCSARLIPPDSRTGRTTDPVSTKIQACGKNEEDCWKASGCGSVVKVYQ